MTAPQPELRITRRGWLVIVVLSATFGFATGDWTYYSYEAGPTTQQEATP